MKKIALLLLLCLITFGVYSQGAGNWLYQKKKSVHYDGFKDGGVPPVSSSGLYEHPSYYEQSNYYTNNNWYDQKDSSMIINIKAIINVKADSYIMILGLSQVSEELLSQKVVQSC